MLFRMAWLNIWRNKRRTLITMGSVFFAVIFAVIMRSSVEGVFDNMVNNLVSFSSGFAQVHQKGYWDDRTLDNAFPESKELNKLLMSNSEVTDIVPRFESFALASGSDKTKGVMVIGIDPAKEKTVTKLNERIISGKYPDSINEPCVLLGSGLASHLKLKENDTLILISQGYHGSSAAGKFTVKGIVSLGSPQLNDNMVYLTLKQAQAMYGAQGLLTSVSIMIKHPDRLQQLMGSLKGKIDTSQYELLSWKQMMPDMDQFIEADSAGHFIYIGILYMIIAFGIFSTLLMMTMERTHEFGILIAIGMKKRKLVIMLFFESLMISLLGCLMGIIAASGLVSWFVKHPIYFTGQLKEVYERYGFEPTIHLSTSSSVFINQAIIVLILASLMALYPGMKILKLKPVQAINS